MGTKIETITKRARNPGPLSPKGDIVTKSLPRELREFCGRVGRKGVSVKVDRRHQENKVL